MLNLRKYKIRTQLIILLASVVTLFLVSTLVSWQALNQAKSEFTSFINQEQRVLLNYTELYANGLQMGQALRNIILDPANPKAYENFDKASTTMDKLLEETRALVGEGKQQAEALGKVAEARGRQQALQVEVRDLVKQADIEAAKERLNKGETPVWREIRQALLDLIKEQKAVIDAREVAVQQNTENAQTIALILTIIAVLVGLGIALTIVRNILSQLNLLGQSIESLAAGEGDLTVRLQIQGDNELCRISVGFNNFISGLQTLVNGVKGNAGQLHALSANLAQASSGLRVATADQTGAVTSTAAAVEEMSASIASVADNASQVESVSTRSAEYSDQGLARMKDLDQAMGSVQSAVKGMSDSVEKFLGSTQAIIGATQHVKDIAEQINLLALNAAIEAARAGEQGRGFAVVADEVRKLAEKTAQHANEITRVTADLNAQSGQVEAAIKQGAAALEEGSSRGSEVSRIVAQAHSAVLEARRGIAEISHSMQEQSRASHLISNNIERLANLASGTEHAISQSDQTVQEMRQLADQLTGTVGRFRS
ncbi:MAG: methyl-accepting chemotaxis protein [Pseudomonadota bacterium]|nr:methyl-accepting chemotaxis protein [Pseudomonadota bacterium]